jgi:hypothetical protein
MTLDEALALYDNTRTRYFGLFDGACNSLASSITSAIPLLRELEARLRGEPRNLSDTPQTLAIRVSLKNMLAGVKTGVLWMRLSDITQFAELLPAPNEARLASLRAGRPENWHELEALARIPEEAVEIANRDLICQFLAIRSAAWLYTITDADDRRMVFEHNLVRAGADICDVLRDYFRDTPETSRFPEDLQGVLEELFLNFASVLESYDDLAKLKRPTESDCADYADQQSAIIEKLHRKTRWSFHFGKGQ